MTTIDSHTPNSVPVFRLWSTTLALVALCAAPAFAQQTFTNSNDFFIALGGVTPVIEDFETEPLHTVIPFGGTLNGLTFSNWPPTSFGGLVADMFAVLDAQNLACERDGLPGQNGGDPAWEYFWNNDSFTVTFPQAITAVGIYFNIGTDPVLRDYVYVETPVATAYTGGEFYDTGAFFFAGVISPTPFNVATFGAGEVVPTGFIVDNLVYATGGPQPCVGDLNGDGVVDLADLGILLADFGCTAGPGNCPGDIDGDGDTDLADLGILLAEFGTTCP